MQKRTRLAFVRHAALTGDRPLTVNESPRIPYVTAEGMRDMVLGLDEFLNAYMMRFDEVPAPANVATTRLERAVAPMSEVELATIEQRTLMSPPVASLALQMQLAMSNGRVRRMCKGAGLDTEVALGAERDLVGAHMREALGPSPSEADTEGRIVALRGQALPNDADRTTRRTRAVIRLALLDEDGPVSSETRKAAQLDGPARPVSATSQSG